MSKPQHKPKYTLQFSIKRLSRETDKAYVFLSTTYGGKFITFPKSRIKNVKRFKRALTSSNDTQIDWIQFDVEEWIYNINKEDFKYFSAYDFCDVRVCQQRGFDSYFDYLKEEKNY